jgi:DNA-binding LacI/PurR family transcriptional regulator
MVKQKMPNQNEVKTYTLSDIALRAGVSKATVSKVLLGSGKNTRVSVDTASRIQKTALELNYQPNFMARRLAGKPSQMIGVIIDSFAPQSDFSKLSEMEQMAAKRGYRFMIGQSHDQLDGIEAYASDFVARGTDGIICISHQYPDFSNQVSSMFSRLKNVVFIHQPSICDEKTCFVDVDVEDGMRTAFFYLLNKGRKRIALNVIDFNQTRRINGYNQARAEAGMGDSFMFELPEIDLINFCSEHNEQIIYTAIEKQIREHQIDAVLAASDIIACLLIRAIKSMGKRVPQDISVIAYENLQLSYLHDPRLTTLDPCNKEQSQHAITLLMDMIEGKEIQPEQRQVVFKPKLVVRESA